MELINREDVIYAIVNTPSEPDWNIMPNRTTFRTGSAFRQHEIIDIINKMPVIESRPKGYWIAYAENNTPIMLRCSICTHSVVWGSVAKYCPNCGAEMRNERILSCDRTKCHENEINDVPCEECECYSDTRGEEE